MKTHPSLLPALRRLLCLLLVLIPWLPVAAQEGREFPLGPIGGHYSVTANSSLALVRSVDAGGPGALAGLQAGDYIHGAFGKTFTPTGGSHYGVTQELGFAVDRAEAGDGILPLLVIRAGTGGMVMNVGLPASGAFGPAYPRNSPKYAAMYENAVADLHTRTMNSGNGYTGYLTGFTGLCLLGHPNWNDTTGAKPYRLSINKIRDLAIQQITNWGYAPTESALVDGSPIPNPSGGPSNWELGPYVMFLSEYYAKTSDSSVLAPLQRGTEMCANTVQWWKQPVNGGLSPEYDRVAGMSSHGGVTGDYMHQGWYCGINMNGVHNLGGMAFARRAGTNMSVRPKDGHYFGFTNLNPGDPIPNSIVNALPSSITLPQYAADPVRGLTLSNTSSPVNRSDPSDPFWYNPSVNQKYLMQMNFICRRSLSGNGSIGYAPETGDTGEDGGRTPGGLLGLAMYRDDVGGLDAADLNRLELMKSRITNNYMNHQLAHVYLIGGQVFQQLATPYLNDRQQRFFMDNWRFYYALARNANNGPRYFQNRTHSDAGAYLSNDHCALINAALPYGIANGGYSLIPGYNTNRTLADFKSPALMWPTIAAHTCTVTSASQAFQIDVCDGSGNVLAPANYTAAWSHVSGPATATFSSNNTANTTITFPSVSPTAYRVRLTVTRAGFPDLVEDIDVIRANATTPVPPSITTHPAPQSTVPGGGATFSVAASGTGPFVYQWRLNGVSYWVASPTPTLTLTNVGSGHLGSYDCVITTPEGTLVSNAATLSFNSTLSRTPGGLRREVWTGLGGSAVADLTASVNYPLFPRITSVVTSAGTTAYGDNYGQKLSGWLRPPVSGAYRFFIASDDASQLWLSTDDSAAAKVKIAEYTGSTNYRSYSTGAQSGVINLVAGQKYYIELLHKEAGGGDHASLAWQMPGEPVPANGSAPIDGVYLEYDQYLPLLTNHWKLDEASGSTCADSVGTAAANLMNGPTRVAGVLGNAVNFNGVNQYGQATVTVSESVSAVSLWFRTTQASGGLFSVVDGASSYDRSVFLTGGNISAYIYSGETITTSGTAYNDGQWHHLVHTFGGGIGGQKLYVDGVQVAAGTKAQSDFNWQTAVRIGHAANSPSPYFNGQIDEVRIYNAGLSVPDAEALYTGGLNAAPQISAGTFTVVENAPAGTSVGTLTATDTNAGQTIGYSIVAGNVGGRFALNPTTGALTVAVPPDFETSGAYVLTIAATDNGSPVQSTTTTATINVTNVNEGPVFASNPVIGSPAAPGVAYGSSLTAIDPEGGGAVTYQKTGGPSWLSVASDGTLSGTPVAGDIGLNDFSVSATDSTLMSTNATLRIDVVNVAVTPFWTNAAGGSWPVAVNWLSNGIANGASIVADFSTLNLTADTTVTLNGARTIGGLKFGDTTPSHNWSLATGSGGPLTLSVASGTPLVRVGNQTATLNTVLAGTKGMLKSGSGTLALGSANTYSGTTTISQGRLQLNVGNALPSTSNIVIGDANSGSTAPNLYLGNQLAPTFATLTVGSNVANAALHTSGWAPTISGITTLNSPLTIRQYNGGGVHTGIQNTGKITGPGAGAGNDTLIFSYSGGTNFYWQANNTAANDFTGNIRVTGVPGNMNAQGGANGPNNVVIPDAAMVTIDAGCNFAWNNFGNNAVTETFDGLAGAGSMIRNNGGGLISSLNLTINANNASNEGDRVFTGGLASLNSFTFGGSGTQVFGGASSYTGPTTINGGTLLINGSLANTPTTITAAGRLGGSGSIAGTVSSSGTLAPGNDDVGNLTISNTLTLAGGSDIEWEIADWTGIAGSGWDKLTATSLNLTATAGSPVTIHLHEVDLANFEESSQSFILVQTSNGITGFDPAQFVIDDSALVTPQGTWAVSQFGNNLVLAYIPPNRAPAFASDLISASAVMSVAFSGELEATDPDAGDTLTFTKTAGPAWLNVAADGTLSGTPGSGTTGINTFTVRVTDGDEAFDTATLEIEVVDPAVTPFWINPAGGSWPVTGNWLSNSMANGASIVADFSSLNLTAHTTVTLDGARTIGGLKFGDTTPSHNWTLNTGSGGPLTLSIASGSPVIRVSNQTATLNTVLTGAQGLVKSGAGTLTLGAANSLTGGMVISQGTLAVSNHSAIAGATLTLGDASTGANATGFRIENGVSSPVIPASITTTSHGSGHAITLNAGSALAANAAALSCPLTLSGSVPLTLKATNTNGHSTAQDWTGRITGTGIATGSTALVLDGSSHTLRLSFGNSLTPNTFTGDVLVQGTVTTQNQTYTGNSAGNQNNGFLNNNLTVASGGTWSVVWGGETIGALNGAGNVSLNCQSALGNTGITLGTTGSNGLFTGAISGGFGLVKLGNGTQVLGGANSYTGATAINGGTLLINGSLANTPTTIAAAGTLGGSGSIAGTVANSGTLSPGNSTIGNFTVTNTLTLAGGSHIVWEIADWTGTAGTGWDKITANSLNLTATSGNPVTIHLDETTLAHFTETSQTFTLVQTTSGITGFSANKFVIDESALPTPQGTWAIQQSGNNLVLAYTLNPNPVGGLDANDNDINDDWETANFGNANAGANLPGDDADKDGLTNLMEYALGTNPLAHNAGPAVDFETIASTKHLRITVNKNPQATNLSYSVETCGALNDWSASGTVIETDTATQLIVRDTFNTTTSSRRFIRLKVLANP
ncbi:autotransporter-associated beta strand repeat-containing protein [Luteolibacter arcticus]|uniref:Autotransporter-associated beta strand repeat-containing protein n=1 Tax=Luteolibacter arcticus TaxID=1581411 RepID=A0ABT3GNG3_9BACT|nr:autotransporter-associated beta strand repeat-containing protein [Luteolibacter arcticus]MCW1925047.1 autotransporter-associated beta strand repeat-containing protein [Luteolibacter arcticus]